MPRLFLILFLAILAVTAFLSAQYSFAKQVKCEDAYTEMKWDPKNHDVNDPSSKEFDLLAYQGSLCELTKCIDHEECTNHDEVNWNKFQDSPAYKLTSEDQQNCLDIAHKNGNGQDGLVGYEIMDCGLNEGYN